MSISTVNVVLQVIALLKTLGLERAKALTALSAFQDNVERFLRNGKSIWFKPFIETNEHTLEALEMLMLDDVISENQLTILTNFCIEYFRKVPTSQVFQNCNEICPTSK